MGLINQMFGGLDHAPGHPWIKWTLHVASEPAESAPVDASIDRQVWIKPTARFQQLVGFHSVSKVVLAHRKHPLITSSADVA
jgi:hypothetical protein